MSDTNSPDTTEDKTAPGEPKSEVRSRWETVEDMTNRQGVDVGRDDVHHSSDRKGEDNE